MSDERCNQCDGLFRRVHPLSAIVPLLECEDCGRQIPRGAIDYSFPRECVCGEAHLDRATYWAHRVAHEEAA